MTDQLIEELEQRCPGATFTAEDDPREVIVIMEYGRYMDQMRNPDAHWFCPTCGGDADFDIVAYESYGE